MTDRRADGMKVRRQVLGDAHVDRAEAAKDRFDAPFQDLITEGAWGTVWANDAIPLRDAELAQAHHIVARRPRPGLVAPQRAARRGTGRLQGWGWW